MQLFVDQLTVIDSAYMDAQHGLVGESWIVDVVLHGAMDAQSMVMDFGLVKKRLKQAIDASLDHVVIIPKAMPGLEHTGHGWIWQDAAGGQWRYQGPNVAECVLDCERISNAELAGYLEAYLLGAVPENVTAIDVTLRHETTQQPYYHYVHGLKKHDGNCQRIAHGHRSKIHILHHGQEAPALEEETAKWLNYTYLVSAEDITEETPDHVVTGYTAPQGTFQLQIPKRAVRVMQTDSTVECIAQFLAERVQAQHSGEVQVRAYEGVQKGAICTAR